VRLQYTLLKYDIKTSYLHCLLIYPCDIKDVTIQMLVSFPKVNKTNNVEREIGDTFVPIFTSLNMQTWFSFSISTNGQWFHRTSHLERLKLCDTHFTPPAWSLGLAHLSCMSNAQVSLQCRCFIYLPSFS
jgi:hypothetical protein